MGYSMEKAFERLGCQKIYEDKVVVVAGSMRRRGLGDELHLLAEERGCEYHYLWATGEYCPLGCSRRGRLHAGHRGRL